MRIFQRLKHSIINSVFVLLVLLSATGCSCVKTSTVYNKQWTKSTSTSKPISLGFKDNQDAQYHFLLRHDYGSRDYMLYVYWDAPNADLLFNSKKSTLKFFIDRESIIELVPIKTPKIISYNLETKGHQEEGCFALTESQIRTIANAKYVDVELTGKYITVAAQFNKFHTFKAFKDFINIAP